MSLPLIPPVCIIPTALLDNPAFAKLSKPVRDRLAVVSNELVRSVVSLPDNPHTIECLRAVPIPHYPLSHWLDEDDVRAAMEWHESEGIVQSTQIDDRPAVRFTNVGENVRFHFHKPETKWLADKLRDRIVNPQGIYYSGAASPLETRLYDSMTYLSLDLDFEAAESETITRLPVLRWLKAFDSQISLESRKHWFSADRQTKRISSPLVNLPREWRNYLRLDGEPVAIVSVPHLESILLGIAADQFRPAKGDTASFQELARSGRLFGEIASAIGESAEITELLFRRYIYSEPTAGTEISAIEKAISKRFRNVSGCVSYYGVNGIGGVTSVMDKLWRTITDHAATAVFTQLTKSPLCALVSDGLIVKREAADVAQQAIVEAFRQYGVTPTIDVSSI